MKYFFSLLLLLVSALSFAEERELVIIHTNDFHGHIKEEKNYAGAARIAAFVKKQRAAYDGVLFMDAGDSISGTPVSTMFNGIPIFTVMNAMQYDIGLIGNHEFDHGFRQIEKFKVIANQPLLGANSFDPDGDLIADTASVVKVINGIRVGVIGVVSDYTPRMITPSGNEGLRFEAPIETLLREVPKLRRQADVIVVLSHIGHREDKLLASKVRGIDLIVGGHSHTLVEQPVKVGNTWIVQANEYGSHVGVVNMSVDITEGTVTELRGRLVPAKDLPDPDLAVLAVVNTFEEQVEQQVDIEIATSNKTYEKDELQALFEAAMTDVAKADFGYYNRGGIRDVIRKGPVAIRDIWNIEPFGNTLVSLKIKGSDYLVLISQSSFVHPTAEKIEADRTYTVATNSFIGAHAEKAFGEDVELRDLGVLIRDVLIDHIKENPGAFQ